MTQKMSPFVEAKWGWDFGESGWNVGMDENLLKFSFLFDRNIDGIVDTLPSPTGNKVAYYLKTDRRVYFTVDGSYYSTPLPKWFSLSDRGSGVIWQFNGSSLEQAPNLVTAGNSLYKLNTFVNSLDYNSQGDYMGGLVLSERNDYVLVKSEISGASGDALYKPAAGTTLPLTLTGTWAIDSGNLVLLGDDVLRQDLAAAGGATMVGSGVMAVDSIAGLLALPADQRREGMRYLVGGYAGGEFYWSPTSTGTHNGGTIFEIADGVAGRWMRQWSGKINIQWFGAMPDGSVSASAAIQAAINFAYSTTRSRTVYAPSGDYSISATVLIPSSRLYIEGDGQGATRFILGNNVGIGFDVGDNISPVDQVGLSGFSIRGGGNVDANTHLVRSRFCQKTVVIRDIEFNFSAATGLHMEKCWGTEVSLCHFYFVGYGAYLKDANDVVFSSNYLWNNNKTNLTLVDGSGTAIFGNAFESWGLSNPSLYYSVSLTNHKSCNFFSNWLETAKEANSALFSDATSSRLNLVNNVIFGSSLVNHLVQIGGASSYIARNRLAISNASRNHVALTSGALRTRIEENEYIGSSSPLNDQTGGSFFKEQPLIYRGSHTFLVDLAIGGVGVSSFTLAGAAVGDFVDVSGSVNMLQVIPSAYVSSVDTVTIVVKNDAGVARNLGTVTFRVKVTKKDF